MPVILASAHSIATWDIVRAPLVGPSKSLWLSPPSQTSHLLHVLQALDRVLLPASVALRATMASAQCMFAPALPRVAWYQRRPLQAPEPLLSMGWRTMVFAILRVAMGIVRKAPVLRPAVRAPARSMFLRASGITRIPRFNASHHARSFYPRSHWARRRLFSSLPWSVLYGQGQAPRPAQRLPFSTSHHWSPIRFPFGPLSSVPIPPLLDFIPFKASCRSRRSLCFRATKLPSPQFHRAAQRRHPSSQGPLTLLLTSPRPRSRFH